mgnify:CR=1 FL=1
MGGVVDGATGRVWLIGMDVDCPVEDETKCAAVHLGHLAVFGMSIDKRQVSPSFVDCGIILYLADGVEGRG